MSSGHAQRTTEVPINARFGLLRLFSHIGKIQGSDIYRFVGDVTGFTPTPYTPIYCISFYYETRWILSLIHDFSLIGLIGNESSARNII